MITDWSTLIAPEISFAPVYRLKTLNERNFPLRLIPNTFKMRRILKKIDPDLVHLNVHHFYSPAIFSSGFGYLLTSWGIEVLKLPYADLFRRSIAKIAAMKASRITVDAKCLKDIWVKMGVPANKIVVIPFGIDTTLFNPNVDGHMIREKLGIDSEDVVVISTRLFNYNYDVECLIEAIPFIVKNYENVKFIIKGAGPLENYLKNLAHKLKVYQHIRFVRLVPYNEIPRYLCAADIYVSTRSSDTTSVSLLEAMACGLPPVVANVDGNQEWIQDRKNGFLFPVRNTRALAEKTMQLVENSQLRKQFGERCLKLAKTKAAWGTCVTKMDAVYKSMLQ